MLAWGTPGFHQPGRGIHSMHGGDRMTNDRHIPHNAGTGRVGVSPNRGRHRVKQATACGAHGEGGGGVATQIYLFRLPPDNLGSIRFHVDRTQRVPDIKAALPVAGYF